MRTLKFIAGAAVIVSALVSVTAASAADLPARTYTKAPVYVDPGFNWSGFYLGGNIGYSWGTANNSETLSRLNTGAGLVTATASNDVNGVIGGGQIGYNWQMSRWLLDRPRKPTFRAAASADRRSSSARHAPTSVPTLLFGSDPEAGLVWHRPRPRRHAGSSTVLLYATSGLAYGEVETGGSITRSWPFGYQRYHPLPQYVVDPMVGWTRRWQHRRGRTSGNWTAKLSEYLYAGSRLVWRRSDCHHPLWCRSATAGAVSLLIATYPDEHRARRRQLSLQRTGECAKYHISTVFSGTSGKPRHRPGLFFACPSRRIRCRYEATQRSNLRSVS